MEPYTAISSAGPGDMPAGAALILTLFSVAEGDALPSLFQKVFLEKTEVIFTWARLRTEQNRF
jgi:hypothetical protein